MRALICVGCNIYDASPVLQNLGSACKDAREIFKRLIEPDIGVYDLTQSVLLESPTLSQVNTALRAFTASGVDTFTFYFAGHGVQKAGAYYLCLRDTSEQYSTTALSVTQLFAVLNEAQPLQSNVIIDACQAGGVVFDLSSLLKPDLIGSVGTQGVSILAGSALDKAALETCDGGMMTNALLRCIDGDLRVQGVRQTLDLIEIGRVVSAEVLKQSDQSPACWSLNLYGEGRFCINPFRPLSPETPTDRVIESLRYVTAQSGTISKRAGAVWELYQSIPTAFDFGRAALVLGDIVSGLASDEQAVCGFVRGISETFGAAAARCNEAFRESEIYALCTVVLLPYADNVSVESTLKELALRELQSLRAAFEETRMILGKCPNSLAFMDGTAGYFYLPLRLSELLGWLGVADRIGSWLSTDEELFSIRDYDPFIKAIICFLTP